MRVKLKFDGKSLIFKLWAYFALFAALLMIILWFLQIFFLRTYYQEMKISETRRIAGTIRAEYGHNDFFETINTFSRTNDLFIHVETTDGTIMFSPFLDQEKKNSKNIGSNGDNPPSNFNQPPSDGNLRPKIVAYGVYIDEMANVKEKLLSSPSKTASIIIPDSHSYTNTLAYGAMLDDTPSAEVILYIFSPLYPVESTVDILANQLIYVTSISLILAFILSFYLSNRIARPIRDITKSASKLAEGEYGITFEGGHYTEIIRLADTLTHTSMELAKTDNLQKDLIANVSHDLRTPLTMVKSYAEMVRDLSGDDPVKRSRHLQVIIDEADRLNLLVGDLLVLSRMQSGVDTLNLTEFNLRETVAGLMQSYQIYTEQDGYDLNFCCDEEIWIKGDETRIKQVFSNLINNAIRYSSDVKVISVVISKGKNSIRCEVIDSGQGIAQEELEHIWERYYKASSNHSRNTKGSGLGLSIVKEILQLHGAAFGVESEPGRGSNFWFELKKYG